MDNTTPPVIFETYSDVIGVDELREMLGKRDKMISKKLAYRLLKQNIIPSIRVGREYRIAKTDVINFVTNK